MNLLQTLRRAPRSHSLAGILWLSTIAGFGQAPVFTNTTVANGFFQTQVLIASNANFTIETSTNLTDWQPVGSMVATNDLITLVDPRGTAGFDRQFYRIALGSIASFNFSFLEFADAGSFGGNLTPNTSFPVMLNSYSASLDAEGDTNYPAATNVFFTGPDGSGLTNSPGNPDNSNTNGSPAFYQSSFVTNPAVAPGGTWTVNYKGSNQVFTVTAPPETGHVVVPLPTAAVSGGVLQSVSWVYEDAGSGTPLGGVPAFMSSIQLQVHGTNAANELYDSDQLPPGTTSNILTNTVTWSGVSGISMAYQDTNGINYIISFVGPASGNGP
jgi:hypothetical protein